MGGPEGTRRRHARGRGDADRPRRVQTLDLKRHPELVFGELNPLLGPHPSDERILLMGAAGAFFTAGLWYAVPPEGRWVVPSVVMVLETFVIVGNARAGLTIGF